MSSNTMREHYSLEELDRMLACLSQRSASGLRDRCFITLASRSGLRCAEMLALLPTDIQEENGNPYVLVRNGKGGKVRRVPVKQNVLDAIARWMGKRRQLGIRRNSPLFCSITGAEKGAALSTSAIRQKLLRLQKKTGIEKRLHPHGLRHTAAVQWANRGVPVPIIQRLLGHSSLTVTAIYLASLSCADVSRAMNAVQEW